MAYTYSTKLSGGIHWINGEQLMSSSLNHDEDYLVGTIDGYGGGTYSPTSLITINGSGLEVGGAGLGVNGVEFITGAGTPSLFFEYIHSFVGTICDGYITINGTQTTSGAATFNSTVLVSGGTTTLNGSLIANGACSFNGVVNAYAAWGFNDEIILAGGAAIRKRHTNAANADTTYNLTGSSGTDIVNIQSGVVTAPRTYKIGSVGGNLGNEMEFTNWTSFTHTIQNPSGGTIGTVAPLSGIIPGRTICRYTNDGVTDRWLVIQS